MGDRGEPLTEVGVQTSEDPDSGRVAALNLELEDSRRACQETRQLLEELRCESSDAAKLKQDLAESCELIVQLTKTVQEMQQQQQPTLCPAQARQQAVRDTPSDGGSSDGGPDRRAELSRLRGELEESRALAEQLQGALSEAEHRAARQQDQLRGRVQELTFSLARLELSGQLMKSPAAADGDADAGGPDSGTLADRRRRAAPEVGGPAGRAVPSEARPGRPRARCARQVFPPEQPAASATFPDWRVGAAAEQEGVAPRRRSRSETDGEAASDSQTTTSELCSGVGPAPARPGRRRQAEHGRLRQLEAAYAESSRRLAAESERSGRLERHAAALKTKYRQMRRQLEAPSAD
ncbi:uncharacterized protein LOC119095973, partial [Pollicipes pollicipes]|uniref:uncharacterized protein LOC119095973 n=1 Tax=Pollicipes pollicipes TaxID=41117 RepID=UPI001884A9F0